MSCSRLCAAVCLGTALALRTASLRATPRRRATRTNGHGRGPVTPQMAVDGGPKPPQRMPQASPDTTQPLETTRRTALATAGFCVCGCGAYLATSEDETFLDAAQIKLNDAAKARDERFARVLSCVEIKFTARSSRRPPRHRRDVGSSPLDGASAARSSPRNECTRHTH